MTTEININNECSICNDEIITNKLILSCNHNFHSSCILKWLCECMNNNKCFSCPNCRNKISEINEFKNILENNNIVINNNKYIIFFYVIPCITGIFFFRMILDFINIFI